MTIRALLLDADNNLVVTAGRPELASDTAAIAQAIRLRLQMLKGEWYLDESAGLPYFQEILVKNPNTAQIRKVIAERIEGTLGVSTLESLDLVFDRTARTLTVTFEVSTDTGELVDTLDLGRF
jgi:hypothetical protein